MIPGQGGQQRGDTSLLYLYSSNIRPLYEQDILDLLSAPAGAIYQFRYEDRYLNSEALAQWPMMAGTTTLVHFAIQQEAQYHDAVLLPVRVGEVTQTDKLGSIRVVEFRLGQYVSLAAPDDSAPANDQRGQRVEVIKAYADLLAKIDAPRPYRVSAGLGADVLGRDDLSFEVSDDQSAVFDAVVGYLERTTSFRNVPIYRFLRLTEFGSNSDLVIDERGRFVLEPGKEYELCLTHHTGIDFPEPVSLPIRVNEDFIRLIGPASYEIGSRYDIFRIPFAVHQVERIRTRETVLTVGEYAHARSPRMRLSLRIRPSYLKAGAAVAGTAVGLFLVALPGIVDKPETWQYAAAIGGGILAAFLSVLGYKL